MEVQRAQINHPSEFVPTTFQLQTKVSFCDLLILTGDGQHINHVELDHLPWNITVEPEFCDTWVTLPDASYVQVVDTRTMTLQQRVNELKNANGITFIGTNFAVGVYSQVEIFSKQGTHVNTIHCSHGLIHSLDNKYNRIFCAFANNNQINSLEMDGTNVFTYETSYIGGPTCILSDSNGNVYMLCHQSNSLHKLKSDGKLIDVILDSKTITETASSAAFVYCKSR